MEGLRALVAKEAAGAQISSTQLASSAVQKSVQRYVSGLMQLLVQQHVEESSLVRACEVMRSNEYVDIVSERNIENLCAYPLCQCALYTSGSESSHTAPLSADAAVDDSVLSLHATVRSAEEAAVLQRDKHRLNPIPTIELVEQAREGTPNIAYNRRYYCSARCHKLGKGIVKQLSDMPLGMRIGSSQSFRVQIGDATAKEAEPPSTAAPSPMSATQKALQEAGKMSQFVSSDFSQASHTEVMNIPVVPSRPKLPAAVPPVLASYGITTISDLRRAHAEAKAAQPPIAFKDTAGALPEATPAFHAMLVEGYTPKLGAGKKAAGGVVARRGEEKRGEERRPPMEDTTVNLSAQRRAAASKRSTHSSREELRAMVPRARVRDADPTLGNSESKAEIVEEPVARAPETRTLDSMMISSFTELEKERRVATKKAAGKPKQQIATTPKKELSAPSRPTIQEIEDDDDAFMRTYIYPGDDEEVEDEWLLMSDEEGEEEEEEGGEMSTMPTSVQYPNKVVNSKALASVSGPLGSIVGVVPGGVDASEGGEEETANDAATPTGTDAHGSSLREQADIGAVDAVVEPLTLMRAMGASSFGIILTALTNWWDEYDVCQPIPSAPVAEPTKHSKEPVYVRQRRDFVCGAVEKSVEWWQSYLSLQSRSPGSTAGTGFKSGSSTVWMPVPGHEPVLRPESDVLTHLSSPLLSSQLQAAIRRFSFHHAVPALESYLWHIFTFALAAGVCASQMGSEDATENTILSLETVFSVFMDALKHDALIAADITTSKLDIPSLQEVLVLVNFIARGPEAPPIFPSSMRDSGSADKGAAPLSRDSTRDAKVLATKASKEIRSVYNTTSDAKTASAELEMLRVLKQTHFK